MTNTYPGWLQGMSNTKKKVGHTNASQFASIPIVDANRHPLDRFEDFCAQVTVCAMVSEAVFPPYQSSDSFKKLAKFGRKLDQKVEASQMRPLVYGPIKTIAEYERKMLVNSAVREAKEAYAANTWGFSFKKGEGDEAVLLDWFYRTAPPESFGDLVKVIGVFAHADLAVRYARAVTPADAMKQDVPHQSFVLSETSALCLNKMLPVGNGRVIAEKDLDAFYRESSPTGALLLKWTVEELPAFFWADRGASVFEKDHRAGYNVLKAGLKRFPRDPLLWFRLGVASETLAAEGGGPALKNESADAFRRVFETCRKEDAQKWSALVAARSTP